MSVIKGPGHSVAARNLGLGGTERVQSKAQMLSAVTQQALRAVVGVLFDATQMTLVTPTH